MEGVASSWRQLYIPYHEGRGMLISLTKRNSQIISHLTHHHHDWPCQWPSAAAYQKQHSSCCSLAGSAPRECCHLGNNLWLVQSHQLMLPSQHILVCSGALILVWFILDRISHIDGSRNPWQPQQLYFFPHICHSYNVTTLLCVYS